MDIAILSGFSFGCDKAKICVAKGALLGDEVSRTGRRPLGDRVQAVMDFSPLQNVQQVQQFLGCTNWLRWCMMSQYAHLCKILGQFLRPEATFPEHQLGIGAGSITKDSSEADKAFVGIKLMAKHHIEMGVMDEAAAIDGTRPLEQIADCSGIAWGGTVLQMKEDLK